MVLLPYERGGDRGVGLRGRQKLVQHGVDAAAPGVGDGGRRVRSRSQLTASLHDHGAVIPSPEQVMFGAHVDGDEPLHGQFPLVHAYGLRSHVDHLSHRICGASVGITAFGCCGTIRGVKCEAGRAVVASALYRATCGASSATRDIAMRSALSPATSSA